jgi:hypothetical protein
MTGSANRNTLQGFWRGYETGAPQHMAYETIDLAHKSAPGLPRGPIPYGRA